MSDDVTQILDGSSRSVLWSILMGHGASGIYIGGPGVGAIVSNWVTPSSGNHLIVNYQNNSCGSESFDGVVLDSYEYRRTQSNATWFWTPLRLPGQYKDDETDVFQNWNRFYDPAIGRYYETDAILMTPHPTTHAYAYAAGNPIYFWDSTGRYINSTSVIRPAMFDGANACVSGLGCTTFSDDIADPSPCVKEGCKWKFDVDLLYTVQSHFRSVAIMNSVIGSDLGFVNRDDRDLTIGQHEAGHVDDYLISLSPEALNSMYQTEGFDSEQQCRAARMTIQSQLQDWFDQIGVASQASRH